MGARKRKSDDCSCIFCDDRYMETMHTPLSWWALSLFLSLSFFSFPFFLSLPPLIMLVIQWDL